VEGNQNYESVKGATKPAFSNDYQNWDAKRAIYKHKEDRYNIRGGVGVSDQSFQNNDLIKEMMQSRNTYGLTKSLSS